MRTMLICALFFVAACCASGQNEWYKTPAGFFQNSPEVTPISKLTEQGSARAAAAKSAPIHAAAASSTIRSGGGVDPVAVLHTTGSFVNRGDEYVATLVMRKAIPEAYVYYRVVYPDDQGRVSAYSRVEYFSTLTGNGQGLFRNGLAADDAIPVLREHINASLSGERLITVAITDSRGNLLQEISTRYYIYVAMGPSLHYFRVRPGNVQTSQGQPGTPGLGVTVSGQITGQFPVGVPLVMMFGGPTTDRYFVTSASTDGRTLPYTFHSFMTNREMDVTVYTDFLREAATCRNCILIGE